MNPVTQYLQVLASFNKPLKGYKFSSMYELVFKMGSEFEIGEFPKTGKMGECFMNAFNLASENRELTYCEGYASGIIPTAHAWCVRKDGKVVDPTWKEGDAYVGIPFKLSYVTETICRRKYYGVIDNWQEHWPLVKKFSKSVIDKRVKFTKINAEPIKLPQQLQEA